MEAIVYTVDSVISYDRFILYFSITIIITFIIGYLLYKNIQNENKK